ncbi:MAG: methyltransferase domain-containing protein [Deltaproteobacteria bacterium]|nr:methyltransferase domain-containing protein [Deltaproteobacteria bacterium]
MPETQRELRLEDIENRFGLRVKSHRIGEMDIKVAEVDRVDEMVCEIYPEAVTTHGDAPVWMITWPASFGLAEYLLHSQSVEGLKILELGCGTAATGIALAKGGADVICTDYDPLALTLARFNAKLNRCSSISIRLLDWYKPDLNESFDLVVGSEVVYFEKSYLPLVSVLKHYARSDGKIFLSDQQRPQMSSFIKLCSREGFDNHQFDQMVYLPEKNQPIRITVLNRTRGPEPTEANKANNFRL